MAGRAERPMRIRREVRAVRAVAGLVLLAACAGGPPGGVPTNVDEARRVLDQQGYVEIQNLHATGNGFEAEAQRDGKPVTVDIDGDGIIHTR
jgi:hypothetical protein